ncbi:MAG: hypothetical protein JJU29_04340 [Verrucomicrobia bacterium]|nr:hypothetical protein [Verrucomicrobiota bacterium]MCH8512064.1 hypothetical protein [Kiritimatiellia bacterium]
MTDSKIYEANLQAWIIPESGEIASVERYEGLRDGGGHMVARPVLRVHHALARDTVDGLALHFSQDGAFLQADVTALGFPNEWSVLHGLEAEVTNGEFPLILELTLTGARGRFRTRQPLAAGETATVLLSVPDFPLAQGIHPPWQPASIRLQAQWGDTWETEGQQVEQRGNWPATSDNKPVTVLLHKLRALPRGEDGPKAIVDRYGQRIHAEWPGKIHDDSDLHRQKEAEQVLSPLRPPSDFSSFGGFKRMPQHAASGFFRVEKDDRGNWWFIDPEGWRFWSVGTTGVRLFDNTVTTGREAFFEELPVPQGPFAAAINPKINSPANNPGGRDTVAFYMWNVLRKYGDVRVWRDQVIRRFRSWGFNTLGNWSELEHFRDAGFPLTVTLSTRVPGIESLPGNLPDLHHPEWEEKFEAHVAEVAGAWRDNPYVLGYFVDNEMGWGRLQEGERKEYAERYFSSVSRILKKHDPNHLYLGCRFVRFKPHVEVCRAAGASCDVVTVNSYDIWPRREDFSVWHQETGRPILIGEHHLPLDTPRQVPPLYPAFTPQERERLYAELVEKWAGQPWSLGCHWYQHADQHLTGRPLDGENQPVGVVDITDTPHPEMVRAIRAATANMWEWHESAE